VALSEIPNALLVPREAVNTGPDGQFVYVIKDGTAQQVPVKVMFDDGVHSAVSGPLKKGEWLSPKASCAASLGAKVNITRAKSPRVPRQKPNDQRGPQGIP
jgi:multidrug efflux system membrane fusion protein